MTGVRDKPSGAADHAAAVANEDSLRTPALPRRCGRPGTRALGMRLNTWAIITYVSSSV